MIFRRAFRRLLFQQSDSLAESIQFLIRLGRRYSLISGRRQFSFEVGDVSSGLGQIPYEAGPG